MSQPEIEKIVERELQLSIAATIKVSPDRYGKQTPEEKEALHERNRIATRNMLTMILSKIERKDPSECWNLFHMGNPISREVFHIETGIKLPRGEKKTREAIRTWIGAEKYDRYFADIEEQREFERIERERTQSGVKLQTELSGKLSYIGPFGGLKVYGTFETYIREYLKAGYRPEDKKIGFSTGWNLVLRTENSTRTSPTFRQQNVRAWIDTILLRLEVSKSLSTP